MIAYEYVCDAQKKKNKIKRKVTGALVFSGLK